jgi:hypothetical protein
MTGEGRMLWALKRVLMSAGLLAFVLGFFGWLFLKQIGLLWGRIAAGRIRKSGSFRKLIKTDPQPKKN